VLALGSAILSRAALSAASDPETLKVQKWLLYPGLIAAYVPLVLFMMFWPTAILVVFVVDIEQFPGLCNTWLELSGSPVQSRFYILIATILMTGITALWWTAVGLFTLTKLQWIRAIFYPFAESLSRRRIGHFTGSAFVIFMFSVAAIWYCAG